MTRASTWISQRIKRLLVIGYCLLFIDYCLLVIVNEDTSEENIAHSSATTATDPESRLPIQGHQLPRRPDIEPGELCAEGLTWLHVVRHTRRTLPLRRLPFPPFPVRLAGRELVARQLHREHTGGSWRKSVDKDASGLLHLRTTVGELRARHAPVLQPTGI